MAFKETRYLSLIFVTPRSKLKIIFLLKNKPEFKSNVLKMTDINGVNKEYKLKENNTNTLDKNLKKQENFIEPINNINLIMNNSREPGAIKEELSLIALNDWESLTGVRLIL